MEIKEHLTEKYRRIRDIYYLHIYHYPRNLKFLFIKIYWHLHNKIIISLLFSLFAAIAITFLVSPYLNSNNQNGTLYFLSALPQALAAIFAILFTISIFGAQTGGRITSLNQVIDRWTKIYMFVFIIGIIFPLIQLQTKKYSIDLVTITTIDFYNYSFDLLPVMKLNLLSVDLFIFTFCIFAIIPYLMRVHRILKYGDGIVKLNEEALKFMNPENLSIAIYRSNELAAIGLDALHDVTETAMAIIIMLRHIGRTSVDKGLDLLTNEIVGNLNSLGFVATDKKTKMPAYTIPRVIQHHNIIVEVPVKVPECLICWNILGGLREICIKSIEKDFDKYIVVKPCIGLYMIGRDYLIKINKYAKKEKSTGCLDLIIGGSDSPPDGTILVKNLMEIAKQASLKKEELFCWNELSKKKNEEVNKILKEITGKNDYGIMHPFLENPNKVLIRGAFPTFSFELLEDENKVIVSRTKKISGDLEGSDHVLKVLPIIRKNNEVYVCKFKYENTLKDSLIFVLVIGAFVLKYYSSEDAELMVRTIEELGFYEIEAIFANEYILNETINYANKYYSKEKNIDALGMNTKELIDNIYSFRQIYFHEKEDSNENSRSFRGRSVIERNKFSF